MNERLLVGCENELITHSSKRQNSEYKKILLKYMKDDHSHISQKEIKYTRILNAECFFYNQYGWNIYKINWIDSD